jgi:hypothetical protein
MKYSHSKAMAVFHKIFKLVKNGVLMIIHIYAKVSIVCLIANDFITTIIIKQTTSQTHSHSFAMTIFHKITKSAKLVILLIIPTYAKVSGNKSFIMQTKVLTGYNMTGKRMVKKERIINHSPPDIEFTKYKTNANNKK